MNVILTYFATETATATATDTERWKSGITVVAGSSMVKCVYKSREDKEEANSSVSTVLF